MSIGNINKESLNEVYRELSEIIGIERTLRVYSLYKGQQISFPIRLLSKEYVSKQIVLEYNGSNISKLAEKYHYTERWVREIIKKSGK